MAKQASKPASLRESWRPDPANDKRELRRRIALRLAFASTLCLLAGLFGYLLFTPLFHPTTRLFFLTAGSYASLGEEPIPFFQEDALRFLSSDGSFQPDDARREFFLLESPDTFRQALTRIAESVTGATDVVVMHLSATPLMISGRPFLRCDNFDGANPEQGAVSLDDFLARVEAISASTVVLLLDTGYQQSSTAADFDSPDFVKLVTDQLAISSSESLWVITANSPGESSHNSSAWQNSVFSKAVTQALSGRADRNQDRMIDLDELYRYVARFTSAVVEKESGGNTTQTPRLLTTPANNNIATSGRILASVSPASWRESLSSLASNAATSGQSQSADPKAAEELQKAEAEEKQTFKGAFTSAVAYKADRLKERAIEEFSDSLYALPSEIRDRVRKTAGLDDSPETENEVVTDAQAKDTAAQDTAAQVAPVQAISAEKGDTASGQTAGEDTKPLSTAEPARPAGVERAVPLPKLGRAGDPELTNVQLLQLAWQYCQYLDSAYASRSRPVDQVPHAWRALVAHLHRLEQRHRADAILDSKRWRVELTAEIVGCYQFAAGDSVTVGNMSKRMASEIPTLKLPPQTLPSLGFAEQLFNVAMQRLPDGLQHQIQRFDAVLALDTREKFDLYLAELPTEHANQYSEFFRARQFAGLKATPWSVVSQSLRLQRQFERMVGDPMSSNIQIQQELKDAQRVLLQATRIGLDQIGSNWVDRCLQWLDKAEHRIVGTSQKLKVLRAAWQLRNQLLGDMEAMLQWRLGLVERLGNAEVDSDLERIVVGVDKLSTLLLRREEANLDEVRGLYYQLVDSQARIAATWDGEANALLAGTSSPSISAEWIQDTLLSTSMVRNANRNRVLALKASGHGPEVGNDLLSNDYQPSPRSMISDERRKQASYLYRVAALTGWSSEQAASSGNNADANLSTGQQIALFYRDLPARIQGSYALISSGSKSQLTQTDQLVRLRQAEQALRSLEVRDASTFEGQSLLEELLRHEFLQCVSLNQQLLLNSIDDAQPNEVTFIRNSLERMELLAGALSNSGITPDSTSQRASRISVRGTNSVSLLSDPEAAAEVVWRNTGKNLNNIWMLVDFDSDLIDLEGPPSVRYYRTTSLPTIIEQVVQAAEQELVAAVAGQSPGSDKKTDAKSSLSIAEAENKLALARALQSYPTRPTVLLVPPSQGLDSGQEISLPFKLRRIGSGPQQTKVVWKLIGENEYVRHEVMVQLPSAEKLRLLADGPSSDWTASSEGITLHPLPNRQSEFRLGISNDGGKPRSLSVELLALNERRSVTLPEGFLNDESSREIAARLGQYVTLSSIPDLPLDASERVVWLSLGSSASGPPSEVKAARTEDEPKRLSIRHGLVAVITDKQSNQKYWRRVDFRVRHPRSYVEPMVSYNAASERIEIRLRPTDMLPLSGGGIAVVGRIAEGIPAGAESRLEGSLLTREEILLYLQVPSSSLRELTLELDVDDFPRAFVFKVPCWRTQANIPLSTESQKVQIVSPFAGVSFGADWSEQLIRLSVDTSPGAFQSKRDYLDVGWDLDRDRELSNETTWRLLADRSVDVDLVGLQNARLSVSTVVRDLSVTIPAPAVRNARVNLLARLTASGEVVWSQPVEVIVDTDPPKIVGVEVSPATGFPRGSEIEVRVGTDDAGLSGVESVDLALDLKRSGEWNSAAPAIPCVRQVDGSWLGKMPTEAFPLGRVALLTRATDRAGNRSELAKSGLEVFDEVLWAERSKKSVQEVSGSVTYVGAPLSGAKITLENEKAAIAYQAVTDERGMFRISNVASGKYKVVAIGVAKNRPRMSESMIDVKPPPAPPMRVSLQAK